MNERPDTVTFSPLDPSQKNTFDMIVGGNENLHIVHGPPGTGKSQLVVSLLEGLVARNKKVLFVSQNTEALKVIERMVAKTQNDIGYASDKKYLSLLDFCLMLYNPKHRQLKYLREQYSTLSGKQLAGVDVAASPIDAHLSLKYTNLDHHANYAIAGDDVGFDELVRYFLKYVNQHIAPEPLRELQGVNVRDAFIALDSYQYKDRFHEYNQPKRELVLLSQKKTDIALPDVRRRVYDIKEVVKGEWLHRFPVTVNIDVMDYLNFLKEYSSLREHFDVYRLQTENIDMKAVYKQFGDLLEVSRQIDEKITKADDDYARMIQSRPLDVRGVSGDVDTISVNEKIINAARDDLDGVIARKDRIVTLMSNLVAKYPDIEYASVQDVYVGMGTTVTELYQRAAEATEKAINNKAITGIERTIRELSKADLDALIKDSTDFSDKIQSMGSIKRMLASVPVSIKQRFGIALVGDFEKFHVGLASVLQALSSLMNETDHVKDVLVLKGEPKTSLKKLNITLSDDITTLADDFSPVHELVALLNAYEISSGSYVQTKQEVIALHKSLTSLHRIASLPENRGLFIGSPLEQNIESVNISVKARDCAASRDAAREERRTLWNEAYNTYMPLVVGAVTTEEFESKVGEIHTYLTHKIAQIPKLLTAIEVADHNMPVDAAFETIERAIQLANDSDDFSDEFFTMRQGSTMQQWLDMISVLETYNNDNEVLEYTQHNASINDIKKALGPANVKYVESILSNDISFATFAARIVNALVGELFGRAGSRQKAHVSTSELLKSYERYLKSKRATSYRDMLRNLHRETMAANKELSKQATLQAAGQSTMEKFRHNTKIIADAFPIICATPKDVAKYIAPAKAVFDYVIFDEASQLLPGQALPSIYRAQKTVIIGDPHQMPPNLNASFSLVEQAEDEFDDLGESILDLVLKQPQRQHHLKVHYRSRYNKLFEPSRQAIYSAAGVEPIFEAELASGAPIDILDDLGDGVDEGGYDKNFAKVCESVEEYLDRDERADFCVLFTTGGVLQKFRSYLEEVGYRKHKRVSDLYDNDKILLSTVTNCQGIEGAYTVLYMHHYPRPGAMWFFKEQAGAYKRLNVSITRQREGLQLLLADPRAHWVAACDQKINSGASGPNTLLSAQLMKSLMTNAGEQADETYLDRTLGENTSWFDSPLTEQLYDKLVEHYGAQLGRALKIYSEVGWHLVIPRGDNIDANERNIGFRIDLGIYSPAKKRFVLGIEMDGAMYHSGYEKEHSDYTRQKVLESKGWDIYRIWSTNWLMDMDKEFHKLTSAIDEAIG